MSRLMVVSTEHSHYNPAILFRDCEGSSALGVTSKIVHDLALESIAHYHSSAYSSKQNPKVIFDRLKAQWEEETSFSSSISEICKHPAYRKIIDMGAVVLPFIFQELAISPSHWFVALKVITGQDPVPYEKKGRVSEMTHIWLQWWTRNKYYYQNELSYTIA